MLQIAPAGERATTASEAEAGRSVLPGKETGLRKPGMTKRRYVNPEFDELRIV